MVKDIGLYFYNGQDNDTLATVWNWQQLYTDGTGDGSTTQLMLNVNMHYFSGLDASDVDGTANNQSAGMLDRTLAHEFTHAVMGTNIRYFQKLPKFIKEGSAELTHGIDDERGSTIFRIAYDNDWLDSSLVLDNTGTGSQTVGDGYSGGYMFLRYFARRAALQTLFDSGINPLSIVGTEGADSISNTLDGATIQALGGNDSIENEGDSVLIYGDAGDDSINNYSTNGNSGFDVITDYTEGEIIQIKGVAVSSITTYGNDVTFTAYNNRLIVRNAADKVITYIDSSGTTKTFEPASKLVTLTDGADTYYNAVNGATIDGGAGNDTIENSGASVLIDGGAGNDKISNDGGSNVLIDGGDGADEIRTWGSNVTINGAGGKDSISNYSADVTIGGGLGDDSIYNRGANVRYIYSDGDGSDTVTGFNENSTLQIDGNTYYTVVNGNNVIVHVGDDSILLNGAATLATLNIAGVHYNPSLVVGTEGADTLENTVSGATILGYGGNDIISNSGSNVTIDGGAGNDSISNDSSNVTIDGGAGNDSISNDSSNVTIDGGAGNDSISNDSSNVTIDGGAGNDKIFNRSATVSIVGGDGNDYINNNSATVTIDAGDGNNYISNSGANSKITAGGGNDSIVNSVLNVSISNGKGNDSIVNDGVNVSIDGGDDADYIVSGGSKVSISGGDGNDSIINNGGENMLFAYNLGDGNDLIGGFNATSTLSIGGAKYTSAKSGNDLIFTVGSGKVTLQGAATLSTVNIIGDEEIVTLLTVNDSTASVVTTDAAVKVVDASARTTAVQITGNALANTIISGKGNDTLTGGKGNDVFIYTAGKDVITDYASGDKISLGAAISATAVSGNNVVFTVGKGSLTVTNGKGKALALIDSKGKSSTATISDVVTVTNSTKSPVTVAPYVKTVNASKRTKAVKITGNALANTIISGKGNDTLTGGKGNDLFVYSGGKDVITDYAVGDKISLGAAISDTTISGNNVVFTVGKGSLTINNGKGKKLALIDAKGKSSTQTISDVVTVTNSTKSPVTVAPYVKTVNASKRTKAVKITGNAFANTIIGGKGNDVFIYTAGKDVISDYASGDKISLGAEISATAVSGNNVVFTVGKGSLTVNNAKGKKLALIDAKGKSSTQTISDVLTVTNSTKSPVTVAPYVKTINASARTTAVKITGNALANTISGGTKNDSIVGGKGNDKLYGGGKNVIYGFENDDLLQITGAFSASYNKSAKSIAFKVGKTASAITLRDFGATTTFHVNDSTYQLSGSKLTKK
ncbi:MAG: calcium-binding protein [Quinella sp. 1Q7]|nr:calcium-binding protein [Quinella sp. 1Q7]